MRKTREIVLPGEFLTKREGRKIGNYVYGENDKVYSRVIGIPKIDENLIDVVPLSGKYLPAIGDRVVGIIVDVEVSGWFVDINSPYSAYLPLSQAVEGFVDLTRVDITRFFDIDDVIYCRIVKVSKDKLIQVSMKDPYAQKLRGGTLVKITPSKVARLIGKGGSMINMIKEKTKCEILPGQNGVIWIRGRDEARAIEAILTVEKESHIYGLTDKIQKMLGE